MSVSLTVSLYACLILSICMSASMSLCVSLCLSISLSVYLSVSLYACLPLSLSLSLYLSLSLSLSLSKESIFLMTTKFLDNILSPVKTIIKALQINTSIILHFIYHTYITPQIHVLTYCQAKSFSNKVTV